MKTRIIILFKRQSRLHFTSSFLLSLLLFISCGGGGNKSNGPITPSYVAVSSVSLSKTTSDLEIDNTLQLTATVSPSDATDKTVTWASSNSSIATVTPTGLVTAKAEGTTNITASAGGKKASCIINVKKPIIPVASIELDKTEITITEGETALLKATVKPDNATDKSIVWASSKESIATVDNSGKVPAIKKGTCTITASCGGKSTNCKVMVEKKDLIAGHWVYIIIETSLEPIAISAGYTKKVDKIIYDLKQDGTYRRDRLKYYYPYNDNDDANGWWCHSGNYKVDQNIITFTHGTTVNTYTIESISENKIKIDGLVYDRISDEEYNTFKNNPWSFEP